MESQATKECPKMFFHHPIGFNANSPHHIHSMSPLLTNSRTHRLHLQTRSQPTALIFSPQTLCDSTSYLLSLTSCYHYLFFIIEV